MQDADGGMRGTSINPATLRRRNDIHSWTAFTLPSLIPTRYPCHLSARPHRLDLKAASKRITLSSRK
ncbi:hypothetical protein PUNSTDRAFT_56105 [Punctularia strigosozonata HHB-11173 SS5]|uniref:Uncharacterized protein n=1 Tax=Punctularia strigosozonata (strain HHB-11173) TaxID=741275 RepID=R7S085_PUNST|nr:uncharacterized protein PUNSTDRAFT_56105 [Punctularia strigosozonata HHB-11173 SS5]EIN03653.1 hypothetical protein PUNSTDRAFT_56105 [Punctularia strigosozonata HHB-11173 SS5]